MSPDLPVKLLLSRGSAKTTPGIRVTIGLMAASSSSLPSPAFRSPKVLVLLFFFAG